MSHTLPVLPYAYNALEPHIDELTMETHHSKHHQAYVTNLNNLSKDTPYAAMSLEDVIKDAAGNESTTELGTPSFDTTPPSPPAHLTATPATDSRAMLAAL